VSAQIKKEQATVEKLIAMEWDILQDLRRMLVNPKLSAAEKIRAANAIAYHASVLNKLLAQKGENPQFNDMNLGDFIKGVEKRTARRIRVEFIRWTKRLSLTK